MMTKEAKEFADKYQEAFERARDSGESVQEAHRTANAQYPYGAFYKKQLDKESQV